jgi:hypothetical protein
MSSGTLVFINWLINYHPRQLLDCLDHVLRQRVSVWGVAVGGVAVGGVSVGGVSVGGVAVSLRRVTVRRTEGYSRRTVASS